MIAVLHFIFADVWHFLGVIFLLAMILSFISVPHVRVEWKNGEITDEEAEKIAQKIIDLMWKDRGDDSK